MIKILFFASFRERLGKDSEVMELQGLSDIGSLVNRLRSREGIWAQVFAEDQTVMMALNQEVSELAATIQDGDEIAFFPPVTGG